MKKFETHLQMFFEFWKNNKLIFVVWIFTMFALFWFTDVEFSQKTIGFVDNQTIDINLSQNVRVKNVYQEVGSTAKKGDLLVVFENTNLTLELERKRTEVNKTMKDLRIAEEIHSQKLANGLREQLKLFQSEMHLLEEEIKKLTVYAPFDCIVSEIYFNRGEMVPAFTNIMSLQKLDMRFVHAFVSEYQSNEFQLGDRVLVEGVNSRHKVKGKVILLSPEYKELPERLSRASFEREWGVRIGIKINRNVFKRGEKVIIRKMEESSSFFGVFNSALADTREDETIKVISETGMELSSILTIEEDSFLVADDEGKTLKDALKVYNEKKENWEEISIERNIEVNDVEAVFRDADNSFFVITSLSFTKKNKTKNNREKFVELRYKGNRNFEFVREFEPRESILGFLKQRLFGEGVNFDLLDIEGADYFEDNVFISLKNPRGDKMSYIIKTPLEYFKKNDFSKSELLKIALPNEDLMISSLRIKSKNSVYLTLVDPKDTGKVYETDLEFSGFRKILELSKKLEGVTVKGRSLYLVEDRGKKGGVIFKKEL